MDWKTIKDNRHYLYDNIEEFHIHNKSPVRHYWRDGLEGEWVFTDDNYVCQILKVLDIGGKECVRTVCGTFKKADKKRNMLGDNGIAEYIYSFSGTYEGNRNKKNNSRHFLFAKYIVRGYDVIEAFKKAYPDAKSDDYIKKQSANLLRTENVQTMINEETRRILDEEGVTDRYLIRGYKQVADITEKDTDRLRSLDSLSKISGLFETGKKKTEELTVFAGFTPEQIKTIKHSNEGGEDDERKTELLAQGRRESNE